MSHTYASQKVSLSKVKRMVRLQNKLASNPKFYNEVFTVLHKKEDARFLTQQFEKLNLKVIPKLDLIGDTLYLKNKNQTYKLKLDLENSNRVWINGQEFLVDPKKSFAVNYNAFASKLKSVKISFNFFIEDVLAQDIGQESFAVTAAYVYFSDWWYSKPDRYTPRSLEEVTEEGWTSGSRYCELNSYESEKMGNLEGNSNRTTDSYFYNWIQNGVFPGYEKEMEHIEENYVEDAKDKFPNGIKSYADILSEQKQASTTATYDDDTKVEKEAGFYNQIMGPMIESDLRYFAKVIGSINNQIAAMSTDSTCITPSGVSISCMVNQSSKSKEALDLVKQRECVGKLVARRQEFLRSYYSKYYCGSSYLGADKNIEKHVIDGVYASTINNCMAAVESQFIKRNFFCKEKMAVPTLDPQTNDVSGLQGAEMCDGYFAPVCFRQVNVGASVNCEGKRPSKQCACVPTPERAESGSKTYREKSGGRY